MQPKGGTEDIEGGVILQVVKQQQELRFGAGQVAFPSRTGLALAGAVGGEAGVRLLLAGGGKGGDQVAKSPQIQTRQGPHLPIITDRINV